MSSVPTHSFSELSIHLTEKLSKDEKKNGGIFFTPPSCIQGILALLRKSVSKKIHRILEPSCGSGEFISAMAAEYPDARITGIEFHPLIYESVAKNFAGRPNITIHHADFLSDAAAAGAHPDLIIGNPPYFVMKKDAVPKEYYPYFDGRPNIFALFIIKAARLLQEGGILCFVLPSSFMNSSYYDKTRKYLVAHFTVLHVIRSESLSENVKYIDTAQDTIVLIVQKGSGGGGVGGGVFEKHGMTILSDNVPRLIRLYSGSQSLAELHFNVHVGTVVWNQCKTILTDDASKTRLIYSSNIEDCAFVHKTYKNPEKKAFIDKRGIQAPMIVLNRGYGVGEYQFDYCLITPDVAGSESYLVENHLICITTAADMAGEGDDGFQKVMRSFRDPRTKEFIECYFGNSAINTTELNHMLPIY
jgi:SAM-dependent methyltransferase